MFSSLLARVLNRKRKRRSSRRRKGKAFRTRLQRWAKLGRKAARRFRRARPAVRVGAGLAVVLVLIAAANLAYQVARKPTEVLSPLADTFKKTPEETWREYGSIFQEYATGAIPAELLAALAQIEGAGNPVAHTYWRWSLTWHPLEIFRPASSAVGMYQMTDGALADAQRYCIRGHAVIDGEKGGCPFRDYRARILPAHAVELTAVSLDRQTAAVLARLPKPKASSRQVRELAAIIHLCGAGRGAAFAHRGFRLEPGERCGDHDPAGYLARVDAMAVLFRRLAGKSG